MSWRFWKKTENKKEKLPRPKGIPPTVGKHLVVEMHKDPDWVWNLKCALKQRQLDNKTITDFRVFDERVATAKSLYIKNYTTLDEHPELILFEGWFDNIQVQAEEKRSLV